MPKTYIKVTIPGGKRYRALLQSQGSRRSFKTATQAEEYATAWKDRYQRLKKAIAEFHEFQAELARYQNEDSRLEDAVCEEEQQNGFVDPALLAELEAEDESTLDEPDYDEEDDWEDGYWENEV
jgi:hypothetical protein